MFTEPFVEMKIKYFQTKQHGNRARVPANKVQIKQSMIVNN